MAQGRCRRPRRPGEKELRGGSQRGLRFYGFGVIYGLGVCWRVLFLLLRQEDTEGFEVLWFGIYIYIYGLGVFASYSARTSLHTRVV